MEDRVHHRDMTEQGCAACVSRRKFLGQSALVAAGAALLAACGDGQIGSSGPTGPVQRVTVDVTTYPGLAGVGQLVNINGQIAAKRTGTATFAAFARACTHQGTPVELFQSGFVCPNHLSQFDNNGHVTVGPATRDLATLPTTFDSTTDQLTIG